MEVFWGSEWGGMSNVAEKLDNMTERCPLDFTAGDFWWPCKGVVVMEDNLGVKTEWEIRE